MPVIFCTEIIKGLKNTKIQDLLNMEFIVLYMGLNPRKPDFAACEQQRRRQACTSAQSDQHLCYSNSGKYNSLTSSMQISIF